MLRTAAFIHALWYVFWVGSISENCGKGRRVGPKTRTYSNGSSPKMIWHLIQLAPAVSPIHITMTKQLKPRSCNKFNVAQLYQNRNSKDLTDWKIRFNVSQVLHFDFKLWKIIKKLSKFLKTLFMYEVTCYL